MIANKKPLPKRVGFFIYLLKDNASFLKKLAPSKDLQEN
jgi:hypothetical protein